MRYHGQSFQLQVKVGADDLSGGLLKRLVDAFHDEHQRLYTHSDREAEVELLQIRVRISGSLAAPGIEQGGRAGQVAVVKGSRSIQIGGQSLEAAVYDRSVLTEEAAIAGPAIIEQVDTTILIPPKFTASVNSFGDLILIRE